MTDMRGQGINIITVPVCSKCGRGFIGKSAKDAAIDSQPIWWWGEGEGPMCNGQIMHMDRKIQLERVGAAAGLIKGAEI